MSKELKIVAAIFGSLFALLVLAVVVIAIALPRFVKGMDAASRDPVAIQKTAEKVATFTVPPGYVIESASDLGMTQMVQIAPANREGHSFTIQLRGSVVPSNADATVRGMKVAMGFMNSFVHCDLRETAPDEVVVRGVHVKLNVMQCNNAKFPMRIESGTFPGNANEATVTAMSVGGADFDTKALHALLTSVR